MFVSSLNLDHGQTLHDCKDTNIIIIYWQGRSYAFAHAWKFRVWYDKFLALVNSGEKCWSLQNIFSCWRNSYSTRMGRFIKVIKNSLDSDHIGLKYLRDGNNVCWVRHSQSSINLNCLRWLIWDSRIAFDHLKPTKLRTLLCLSSENQTKATIWFLNSIDLPDIEQIETIGSHLTILKMHIHFEYKNRSQQATHIWQKAQRERDCKWLKHSFLEEQDGLSNSAWLFATVNLKRSKNKLIWSIKDKERSRIIALVKLVSFHVHIEEAKKRFRFKINSSIPSGLNVIEWWGVSARVSESITLLSKTFGTVKTHAYNSIPCIYAQRKCFIILSSATHCQGLLFLEAFFPKIALTFITSGLENDIGQN